MDRQKIARELLRLARELVSKEFTVKMFSVAAYSSGSKGTTSLQFKWEVTDSRGNHVFKSGTTKDSRREALAVARKARKEIVDSLNAAKGDELERLKKRYMLQD